MTLKDKIVYLVLMLSLILPGCGVNQESSENQHNLVSYRLPSGQEIIISPQLREFLEYADTDIESLLETLELITSLGCEVSQIVIDSSNNLPEFSDEYNGITMGGYWVSDSGQALVYLNTDKFNLVSQASSVQIGSISLAVIAHEITHACSLRTEVITNLRDDKGELIETIKGLQLNDMHFLEEIRAMAAEEIASGGVISYSNYKPEYNIVRQFFKPVEIVEFGRNPLGFLELCNTLAGRECKLKDAEALIAGDLPLEKNPAGGGSELKFGIVNNR